MRKNTLNLLLAGFMISSVYLLSACAQYSTPPTTQEAVGTMPSQTNQPADQSEEDEYTVHYTNKGFEPSTIAIKTGETITFKNESNRDMWAASAMHPTHTAYDDTDLSEHCANPGVTTFDECASVPSGGEWSFTFTKAGSWKYHNHMNPTDFGTINVE